jgi:Asp-tRNA(Asn)/Glu-tRNA(Gln) amidotransferase C subunit
MSEGGPARKALLNATLRAKSDVANKVVSMFLHEVSKQISSDLNQKRGKANYASLLEEAFGNACPYCGEPLEAGRLVVEHLDGMNRYRLGFHVPGNVAVACTRCNHEKRRDDQRSEERSLEATGWESFLSHSGDRCDSNCKTCKYWVERWPDLGERKQRLEQALQRIRAFRQRFAGLFASIQVIREVVRKDVEELYRECQDFATVRIDRMTASVMGELNSRTDIDRQARETADSFTSPPANPMPKK